MLTAMGEDNNKIKGLKNCNCEEYAELKEIIEGKKKSKY